MPEEKATTESSTVETEAAEAETKKAEEGADDSSAADEDGQPIDYKAEAERYKRIADDRTKALDRISQARKRREDAGEANDDKAKQPDDIDAKLDTRFDSVKRELYADYIEDALDELSGSEDERALMKTIYEKRITPSGYSRKSVLEDLRDAKLLANRSKFETDVRKKAEASVKKALAEDRSMQGTGATNAGRKPPESKNNLSSDESSFMDAIARYKKQNNLK